MAAATTFRWFFRRCCRNFVLLVFGLGGVRMSVRMPFMRMPMLGVVMRVPLMGVTMILAVAHVGR